MAASSVAPDFEASALPPLPLAVVLDIFGRVPVDQRLLLGLVCRAWRVVSRNTTLWTVLDLSPAGGVARPSDGLLRALCKRAAGSVTALDVSEVLDEMGLGNATVSHKALLAVVAANAQSLRSLRAWAAGGSTRTDWRTLPSDFVERCLAHGGNLTFDVDVCCEPLELSRWAALRALGLRVRRLCVQIGDADRPDVWDAGTAAALWGAKPETAELVAGHPSLTQVILRNTPPSYAGAVVSHAFAQALTSILLYHCTLDDADMAGFARLLARGSLRYLGLMGPNFESLVPQDIILQPFRPSAAFCAALSSCATLAFCAALSSCATLERLIISNVFMFHDASASERLIRSCIGHASLHTL